MRRQLFSALTTSVCFALCAALATAWGWRQLNSPLTLPAQGLFFEVERGAPLAQVTSDLEALGVLRYPRMVDLYAQVRGTATGIQAGEYEFVPGLTGIGLIETLGGGDVYLHQFTLVEGWRFADAIERLRAHPAIAATDRSSAEIMTELGKPEAHPEGQFLPDTYSFPRGTTDIELLGWAHEALWSLVDENFEAFGASDVLRQPYDGLILASIIEKETALDRERGLIAGVLHERLRRGMRLQTDPTVIYGLGDAFDGNLTRAQLDADTPYNTYTRRGPPPTPIALAGIASIRAAFSPIENGALYFVATGEPDGGHVFSATLEEHNAAVQRYLARERAGP